MFQFRHAEKALSVLFLKRLQVLPFLRPFLPLKNRKNRVATLRLQHNQHYVFTRLRAARGTARPLLRCPKNGAGTLPCPFLPFFDRGDSSPSLPPLRGGRARPHSRHAIHYRAVRILPFLSNERPPESSGGLSLVEVTGFEPAASTSQTLRATNCATPRNMKWSSDQTGKCLYTMVAKRLPLAVPEKRYGNTTVFYPSVFRPRRLCALPPSAFAAVGQKAQTLRR